MVQCDGVDNRRAKSDAVPTLLERKRRDMEVKVVMTGTTVQGHDNVLDYVSDYALGLRFGVRSRTTLHHIVVRRRSTF